jgi:hypothetical protein
LYFSTAFTIPEQPVELHDRLPSDVFVGVPVVSVTTALTLVPPQTGIRCAVAPSEAGSTMLPVMQWLTFGLFEGL